MNAVLMVYLDNTLLHRESRLLCHPRFLNAVKRAHDTMAANLADLNITTPTTAASVRTKHGKRVALFRSGRITSVVHFAALALALIPLTTHAATPTWEEPAHPTPAYLSGCEQTTLDDGTIIAQCPEDGAAMVYDRDGQLHIVDGVPLRVPGQWYALPADWPR